MSKAENRAVLRFCSLSFFESARTCVPSLSICFISGIYFISTSFSIAIYAFTNRIYSLSALSGYLGLYLHGIIRFPLFFSFNSDRSNSFRNISSKLSPSLIASYLELCLQSSISLLTLKKPHNATISGTTGQKKRASHSQGSYLIFQVHPDILKYHHSFLQDLP